MTAPITGMYCDRCGTRHDFVRARPGGLARIRELSRGVRGYVLNQAPTFSDAMSDAWSRLEEDGALEQYDEIHRTFSFCLDCRGYVCRDCWNADAGRCLTCVPLPGMEPVDPRLSHRLDFVAGPETPDATAGPPTVEPEVIVKPLPHPATLSPTATPIAAPAQAGPAEGTTDDEDVVAAAVAAGIIVAPWPRPAQAGPVVEAPSPPIAEADVVPPADAPEAEEIAAAPRLEPSAELVRGAELEVVGATKAVTEGTAAEAEAVAEAAVAVEPEAAVAAVIEAPAAVPAAELVAAEPAPAAEAETVAETPPAVEPEAAVAAEAAVIEAPAAGPAAELVAAEPAPAAEAEAVAPAPEPSVAPPPARPAGPPAGAVRRRGAPAPRRVPAPAHCRQCGLQVPAVARFCRRCGARQGDEVTVRA